MDIFLTTIKNTSPNICFNIDISWFYIEQPISQCISRITVIVYWHQRMNIIGSIFNLSILCSFYIKLKQQVSLNKIIQLSAQHSKGILEGMYRKGKQQLRQLFNIRAKMTKRSYFSQNKIQYTDADQPQNDNSSFVSRFYPKEYFAKPAFSHKLNTAKQIDPQKVFSSQLPIIIRKYQLPLHFISQSIRVNRKFSPSEKKTRQKKMPDILKVKLKKQLENANKISSNNINQKIANNLNYYQKMRETSKKSIFQTYDHIEKRSRISSVTKSINRQFKQKYQQRQKQKTSENLDQNVQQQQYIKLYEDINPKIEKLNYLMQAKPQNEVARNEVTKNEDSKSNKLDKYAYLIGKVIQNKKTTNQNRRQERKNRFRTQAAINSTQLGTYIFDLQSEENKIKQDIKQPVQYQRLLDNLGQKYHKKYKQGPQLIVKNIKQLTLQKDRILNKEQPQKFYIKNNSISPWNIEKLLVDDIIYLPSKFLNQ